MGVLRTRLAVALVSFSSIALQLVLMRALSLRFWSHFAYMVIGVALLGYGASGTAAALLRRRILRRLAGWRCGAALAFAVSVPLSVLAARAVPLNVQFLAWDFGQFANVLLLEVVIFVPFLLAGGLVCLALMDPPERISGHYAANLLGAGLGAVGAVLLMHVLPVARLFLVVAGVGYAGGLLLVPYRRRVPAAVVVAVTAAALGLSLPWAARPGRVSQYKWLAFARRLKDTEFLAHADGPLGRIDVVAGEGIHFHPGLSLLCPEPVPPHALILVDGDGPSAVYDARRPGDWAFADYMTAAVGYRAVARPRVLVIGAGGGVDIGLARSHGSERVVALEINPQVVALMTGPLASRGGGIYTSPGVHVVNQEARGYLTATGESFDLIQLPPLDAFGASGAGLLATQESYLYTVESFEAMLRRLRPGGVLCATRWARTPPRDGLRLLDTAAVALRGMGLPPAPRLAMIRSRTTVTVLASKAPLTPVQIAEIRRFAERRGFDLCWHAGLAADEANRFHVLPRPYYLEGARALLGAGRQRFLDAYLFEVAAPTDDRPYFFHFFRLGKWTQVSRQLGRRSRAMLERSYLMLWAALAQAMVLAVVLIVLPLAPGIGALRSARGKAATLGLFLALGAGWMLLEMGFLQRLILYLAHPTYSAATAIGGFLIFGGIGSALSRYWRAPPRRVAVWAAGAVVVVAAAYLPTMDRWLALTQAWPLPLRLLIATATIAPLAVAMGHILPAGLRQISGPAPALVPWAWAVNGLASVAATVGAPVLAMSVGFARLLLVAIACYLAAAGLCLLLPNNSAAA